VVSSVVVVVNWILLPLAGSHSVRVKLLPMLALATVHTVSRSDRGDRVAARVVVQPLPEFAVTGVHEAPAVGPVLAVLQVVVV
jgi:hypothetical protein